MTDLRNMTGGRELVMVSNRLPVDRVIAEDGSTSWRTSPGGLVTAVEPIVEQLGCLWVGWAGSTDERIDPFEIGSMRLAPVELSGEDVEMYYEGFSNGTLWPLYHDVIAQPVYHREWWDRYRQVNRRFAERVAQEAAEDAIVWVHDYQLQLVPALLRELRPDLTISFFLHIPFPPSRLFAQLPWRKRIVEGLLGADVIGFQQVTDAVAFRTTAERFTRAPALGNTVVVPATVDSPSRTVLAQEFPISIDADAFAAVAARPEVLRRAQEIREELGSPKTLMLGIDRLDYTKGIRHRLKAYNELLADGEIDAGDIVFVQVATPSRERVEAYRQLRDEVEVTVGRINGEHGAIGRAPLVYLHRGFTRDEMVALYLAADVLLVTPLRDGMNLVAKEYAACRADEQGVLVLSEFAGAADELRDALLVNPHDIEGLKAAIVRAAHMPKEEQRRRMRSLRQAVHHNDVSHWAAGYLGAVQAAAESRQVGPSGERTEPIQVGAAFVPRSIDDRVRRLAASPALIVAAGREDPAPRSAGARRTGRLAGDERHPAYRALAGGARGDRSRHRRLDRVGLPRLRAGGRRGRRERSGEVRQRGEPRGRRTHRGREPTAGMVGAPLRARAGRRGGSAPRAQALRPRGAYAGGARPRPGRRTARRGGRAGHDRGHARARGQGGAGVLGAGCRQGIGAAPDPCGAAARPGAVPGRRRDRRGRLRRDGPGRSGDQGGAGRDRGE
jgi:trehalose 6-phosphate synthase/phosphatase